MFFRSISYFYSKMLTRHRLLPAALVLSLCLTATCLAAADTTYPSRQPAAFEYTGTYALTENDPNLTGQGVTIASLCRSVTYIDDQPQNDYLLNIEHSCLANTSINFKTGFDADAGLSEHATAIGAILAGTETNAYHPDTNTFNYTGAAPDANIDVYEFWRFVSSHVFGNMKFEADILTMSVGVVFDNWWTRGIERMAEKKGIIVVAGAGNGSEVFDPVLYPAAGANVIGVGVIDPAPTDDPSKALRKFALPTPEHSSSGPTSDGRCGVDIVAPGNCLVPDINNTTDYRITGNFSSFATPVVSGTIALLAQEAHREPDLRPAIAPDGGNCTMRAILLNSATKLPYWHKGQLTPEDDHEYSLDFVQGAGALNAVSAHHQLTAGQNDGSQTSTIGWDNNTIEKNLEIEKIYRIEAKETDYITATLIWHRHYRDEYPFEASFETDIDLRLELWAVNPNNPNGGYLLDYSDSVDDNIEHIHTPADSNCTSYELVVRLSQLPEKQNPDENSERYGLAWKADQPDKTHDYLWYDLNNDGTVDNADFAILLDKIKEGQSSTDENFAGDVNMDGNFDIADAVKLLPNINP